MSDRAPVVDFSTPYDELAHLETQRQRLVNLLADIESSIDDVRGYEAEGERYASYALAWASTIMLTDILRIGLSAVDRRAKLLFKAQDDALARASKFLQLLGLGALTTKADLMKAVDPSLGVAPKLTESVRDAQKLLKDAKVQAPKNVTLVLDLGTAICDDTVLMIDAGMTSQQVQNQSKHVQEMMRQTLQKIRKRLVLIEQEYTRVFEERQLRARTA
jgi:hypothetical protein